MNVGIMSFAHLHAEAYIHNLRAHPQVEVFGFFDEDEKRGKHFEKEFGVKYFPHLDEFLKQKPQAVLICSENANHRRDIEKIVQAGVHILCEKPIATTLEDARAIIQSCEKHHVRLMTAFPMRFSQPMVEIKKMLETGSLGSIYVMNTTNQGQLPMRHRAWFVDKKLAGGGAVMDHVVHLVDLMRWFLGCEVVEVFAKTNRIFHHDKVEVETGGLVMVTFSNGIFATIDCSWSRPDYYPTWGGLTMEFIGENGVVFVDAFKQNLTLFGRPDQHTLWLPWGSDANQGMINEFIRSVKEERDPLISGEDGFKALEVVIAAYRSIELGQPVRLPLEV